MDKKFSVTTYESKNMIFTNEELSESEEEPEPPKDENAEKSTRVSIDPNAVKSAASVNFLFHISDVDTSISKKGKIFSIIKRRLHVKEKLTASEFELEVKKICNCCLKHIKDLHELHLKRTAALEMIDYLITRIDVSYIKTHHVVHLVWSVMSCIHHFQLRFRSGTKSLIAWTRKKKAEECMNVYTRLIHVLPTSTYRLILNSLIIFYKEGKLWTIEFRLTDMICQLLFLYYNIEEALEDMLSTAEQSSLTSEIEPRMLIKVIYEILANIKWSHMSENMIKRFLIMLRKSIAPKPEHVFRYGSMRMGLNICLRNITKNLNNDDLMILLVIISKKIIYREMENDTLLEFGSIAEYAALRYHTQRFSESIPEELMNNIMTMMISENPYHHLFGQRIIQNIMDRHYNRLEFENPRIFFRGVTYNIRIAKYSARDRQYYKKNRLNIYRVLMAGLRHHYDLKINLENIYTYLAITCVEIPCSYVASSIVSFSMAMQEYILQANPPNMVSCHHVHAIVMSLMSLVCYIHKAEVFYNYVALIMERRSELAPHLNPPMKVIYNYAQHHILWNKPDLFFEDWEARYGLWKCFRTVAQKKKPKKNTGGHQKKADFNADNTTELVI